MRTSRFLAIVIALLMSMQMASGRCRENGDWKDKMKAEKVAWLTTAMDLTPAEAEKFWPVYNNMENERREAFGKVMKAYRALDEALKAGKPEKELSALLNAYVNAMKDSRNVEAKFTPALTKILSVEKVARLFVSEEEFRRQQIHRWRGDK